MNTKKKGNLSESIACDFLASKGHRIIDRNYQKRWGEIDIVTLRRGALHFFEVKSDFRLIPGDDGYRPEELVNANKCRKLRRIIATYLVERKFGLDCQFQFHLAIVRVGKAKKIVEGESNEPFSVTLHENLII